MPVFSSFSSSSKLKRNWKWWLGLNFKYASRLGVSRLNFARARTGFLRFHMFPVRGERFPFCHPQSGRLHKTNMWNSHRLAHTNTSTGHSSCGRFSRARHPHHPGPSRAFSEAFNPASTRILMDSSHKARLFDCLFDVCSVIFYIIQACFLRPSLLRAFSWFSANDERSMQRRLVKSEQERT